MKRILSFLIFILLAMGASAAGAQTVVMDEGHVAFDYPDSWLVVSPQLCGVYAPLLADAGLDADDVAKELTDTRTLSRSIQRGLYAVFGGADSRRRAFTGNL